MGETERLGPLQVGVPGNHGAAMAIRLGQQRTLQPLQILIQAIQPSP